MPCFAGQPAAKEQPISSVRCESAEAWCNHDASTGASQTGLSHRTIRGGANDGCAAQVSTSPVCGLLPKGWNGRLVSRAR